MAGEASSGLVTAGWIFVLAYMAVILVFVVRGAVRNKSISDYAIGNIAFSPIAVGLALAASMTSAATFIINPGFIALYGISAVISYAFVLPAAALVSLVVLTKGFRKHGSSVKALTMAQWMGTRYESKGYALFFGFLSLLLITFIVLIIVGLTKVFSKTLNVSELAVLISVVAFVFGYMMFGGANSMVYTNTVQAILMLIVAFILLGSGYEHFSSGVHGFLEKLRSIDPRLVQTTNDSSFLFRDYFEIFVAQIVIGVRSHHRNDFLPRGHRWSLRPNRFPRPDFRRIVSENGRHHLRLRSAGIPRFHRTDRGYGLDLRRAFHFRRADPGDLNDHHGGHHQATQRSLSIHSGNHRRKDLDHGQ
jgi:sodium/pantothenate symporter